MFSLSYFFVILLSSFSSLSYQLSIIPVTPPVQHGEGPFWDNQVRSLYYVDTFTATLLRWKSTTKQIASHEFDGNSIGLVVPVKQKKNVFIVCRDRYINSFKWNGLRNNTGQVTHLTYVDHSRENNQFNDGKVDADGRLWAGTLTRNKDLSVENEGGSLYVIKGGCGMTVKKKMSSLSISNGMAWSKDNKKMFHIDSQTRKVNCYDFDLVSGNIDNERTLFDLENHPDIKGIPDGMTIDAGDNLWVAIFGGKMVLKINSTSGELLQRVNMPVTYVTSVAFGGKNLDILYATTSRLKLTEKEIAKEPHAGSVFEIHGLKERGLSVQRYQF